jgi:hypothetical protein
LHYSAEVEEMKKQNDSDDESIGSGWSSDTDSFVKVETGSTGTISDSEWEKVGSNHSSYNTSSDEEDHDDEDEDEYEDDIGDQDGELFDVDFKIPSVPSLPPPIPTRTPKTTTTTTTTATASSSTPNDLTASSFYNEWEKEQDLDEEALLAQAIKMSLQDNNINTSTQAPPAPQLKELVDTADAIWGYHYLAEAVYEQIKEDKLLKSAYVLFHEYMECPVQLRNLHPWKRVYHAYLSDAAKWNGARGKHKVENLTDTDVYAFLVWRSAESFARFDVTAGPRAIYFSWTQMPKDTWRDTLEIDKIMGEDLRNPTICDRYARVIRINLSQLCNLYKGVLHRVQLKDGVMDSNHWLPTSLSEATTIKSTNLWSSFEPGSSFFSCVPHGCIVMPKGTIPWECIDTLEGVNNAHH